MDCIGSFFSWGNGYSSLAKGRENYDVWMEKHAMRSEDTYDQKELESMVKDLKLIRWNHLSEEKQALIGARLRSIAELSPFNKRRLSWAFTKYAKIQYPFRSEIELAQPHLYEKMGNIAQQYFDITCQVTQEGKMLGRGVIFDDKNRFLTLSSVIPNKEVAKNVVIGKQFSFDTNGSFDKRDEAYVSLVCLDIISSKKKKSIAFNPLSIRGKQKFSLGCTAYLLQGAHGNFSPRDKGVFGKLNKNTIHYSISANKGSIGSPVVDKKGRLIALHASTQECDCTSMKKCSYGIFVPSLPN